MRSTKKAFGIGWRALLALVAGLATLAGCGGDSVAMYGVSLTCSSDSDCVTKIGNGWYCDKQRTCAQTTDAGTH